MPVPGPDDVIVEITAVGICGSDVHYYEHGRIGSHVVTSPMILGHESAGSIVQVGANVPSSRVGQCVALEPGVPCGRCHYCRQGTYNLCPDVAFFATPPIDGAISRYVAIAADFAHAVPPGLSAEQAAMAEPVSVGIWAARRTAIGGGDRVLVTGAGPIGLLAAQTARALGAETPTVTDVNPFRLDCARRLGLHAVSAATPLINEFDVLLECSGNSAALSVGMQALARRGRVALIGMGQDEVSLDLSIVQGREVNVYGVFRYANTYPFALNMIRSGAIDVNALITHRFALEDTVSALTVGRTEASALKALVTPSATT